MVFTHHRWVLENAAKFERKYAFTRPIQQSTISINRNNWSYTEANRNLPINLTPKARTSFIVGTVIEARPVEPSFTHWMFIGFYQFYFYFLPVVAPVRRMLARIPHVCCASYGLGGWILRQQQRSRKQWTSRILPIFSDWTTCRKDERLTIASSTWAWAPRDQIKPILILKEIF